MSVLTYLVISLPVILGLLILKTFYKLSRQREFWFKRGFHYTPLLQTLSPEGYLNILKSRGVDLIKSDIKFYSDLKAKGHPCSGFPEIGTPVLFVSCLDLIKQIYVKNFDHFTDRRDFQFKAGDQVVGKMLSCLQGDEWRGLRTKMSPTFTTGKIRRMFDIMDKSSQRFLEFLNGDESMEVDIGEATGKYLLDVIAGAAFGIESRAFQETSSSFERMAKKYNVQFSPGNILKFVIILAAPRLANKLRLTVTDKHADNFFSEIILQAIKDRENNSSEKRDDFLQILLETRASESESGLADDTICAQSVLFFIAGFDTTQSLLLFGAYQLALNPDVQSKLTAEVDEALKQNGGKLSYDIINNLEYMDKFVSETLRMHAPAFRLERQCTKDHVIDGTDLLIPQGTVMVIPVFAIHYDEDIYPNPTKFDPERFSKEVKAERNPYAYMPFGIGPRNCIGMRFAITESKLALAYLVSHFRLEPSPKTPIPLKYARSASLKPESKIYLRLYNRK